MLAEPSFYLVSTSGMIFFIILCFCYFSPISKKRLTMFSRLLLSMMKKKKEETKISKSVGVIVRLI